MKPLIFSLCMAFSVGAVACGGDDETAAEEASVNETSAKQSAQQTVAAVDSVAQSDDNGQLAANQLMQAATASQGVLSPAPMGGGSDYPTGAGTCECDAATQSCTFQDCGDDAGQSSMTGTLSWADGKMLCDLNFVTGGLGGVGGLNLTTTCDLVITDAQIDGTLTSDGSIQLPQGQTEGAYSWSVTTTFNAVTYAGGQPSGGTIDVTGTYDIAGQTYAGEANVALP